MRDDRVLDAFVLELCVKRDVLWEPATLGRYDRAVDEKVERQREAKFAAAEAFFEKYGIPPLNDEAIERIEAEWRGELPKKKRRRAA